MVNARRAEFSLDHFSIGPEACTRMDMIHWFTRRVRDGLARRSITLSQQDLCIAWRAGPRPADIGASTTCCTSQVFNERAQIAAADQTVAPVRTSPAPDSLRWPDVNAMLQADFTLTWIRRVKYEMRLWRTIRVRRHLLDACVRWPFAATLLRARPRAFYPLMNHLLDRRLAAEARLVATLASLQRVQQSLTTADLNTLVTQELTLLTLSDGTRLGFSLNGVSFHEGLWQVGLTTSSGTRLYSIGFGFTDDHTILIANVQGPSLGQDGLDLIREATRAAHGMRPVHLLLHALRRLAALWGVTEMLGVDPRHHIKGRWNVRQSRLRFDYRAFWLEVGASPHASGNWLIPLAVEPRPLEAVPAKRRAMYRRRYAMLAQIEGSVGSLRAHAAPTVSPKLRADPVADLNMLRERDR